MSCSCARGLPAVGPAFLRHTSLVVCPGTAPSDAPAASCPAGRGNSPGRRPKCPSHRTCD
eukprot:1682387-Prorocentrum_lima.AAC.1